MSYEILQQNPESSDYGAFRAVLYEQSNRPPLNDRHLAAYTRALHELTDPEHGNTVVQSAAQDIIQKRRTAEQADRDEVVVINPSSTVNMFIHGLKAFHSGLFETNTTNPHDMADLIKDTMLFRADSIESHKAVWRNILCDTDNRERFTDNVVNKRAKSAVIERAVGLKIAMHLLRPALIGKEQVLDVGGSSGIVLGNIVLNRFNHSFAINPGGALGEDVKNRIESVEEVLNLITEHPVDIAMALNVDLDDPSDPEVKKWIAANSFYLQEFENTRRLLEYNYLHNPERMAAEDRRKIAKIIFQKMDILDIGSLREMTKEPKYAEVQKIFGIVNFSTMLHQLQPEDRIKALSNIKMFIRHVQQDTGKRGFVVVQDFCYVDPQDKRHLRFYDKWFSPDETDDGDTAHHYRLNVLDMGDEEEGFQELLRWQNARCTHAQIGDGTVRLDLSSSKRYTVLDMIDNFLKNYSKRVRS